VTAGEEGCQARPTGPILGWVLLALTIALIPHLPYLPVWIPLAGLALSALHIPWTPVAYGAAVLVVSAVLGRREQYRKLWRDFGASIPPLAFTTVLGCVAASLALAVVIQRAFAGFAASPHLHDASNHAFMVSQVVRHASLDRHLVFGPPYGSPPQDYLLGWHAAAALTCRLTGTLPTSAPGISRRRVQR